MSRILCDTNVLIELYKGIQSVILNLETLGQSNLCISDVTAAELLFGARNKRELNILLKDIDTIFRMPVEAEISGLAVRLVSTYALSHRLSLPDALIAATAMVHQISLYTMNKKDFRFLPVDIYEP